MEWEDTTSYSQGDKERIPRTWLLRCDILEIIVTKHIYNPGWNLICRQAGVTEPTPLHEDLNTSKIQAVTFVLHCFKNLQGNALKMYNWQTEQ